jgi:tetratricopeptide (TPR) repeat protein
MSLEFSKNPLVDKLNKILDFIVDNKKAVAIYIMAFAFLGLIFGGYVYYRSGVERRAHKDLLTALKTFDAKVVNTATDENLSSDVFSTQENKWKAVDSVFNKFYEKNQSSGIASGFLAYRVEALLNLDLIAEAIEVQKLLIKKMPSKSALIPYNKIKLALMYIDTDIEDQVKLGLDNLRLIAYEQGSVAQDEALYRLGQYFWNKKDFKEAANYWNQLTIKFGKNAKYPSSRAEEIRPMLKTIIV